METVIRSMCREDKDTILDMMRVFYASPAVLTNGSDEIFLADIEGCISDNPYIEGFVIDGDGEILGYSMIAKSFSTEYGKPCIWIEDLYIKENYRGIGLGKQLMDFIVGKFDNCIFRLEAEAENERAIALYKKCGFSVLAYTELKK